jgi:hypothetical protein
MKNLKNKKFILFTAVLLFLGNIAVFSQTYLYKNIVYLPKSDNYYDEREYRKSIEYHLKQADEKGTISSNNAYVLSQDYSLLGIQDSAFFYLNLYINSETPDCRSVYVDEDFNTLKKNKKEWTNIINQIENKYIQGLETFMNSKFALKIFHLEIEYLKYEFFLPIAYRRKLPPSDYEILKINFENNKILKKLIKKYGFPTITKVGYAACFDAYLILNFSKLDDKLYFMAKQAYENKDLFPEVYASLTDKWLLQNKKKQLYGTSFSSKLNSDGEWEETLLQPVEDFKNLNKRREEMGLSPIEEYAKKINGHIPEEYYNEN